MHKCMKNSLDYNVYPGLRCTWLRNCTTHKNEKCLSGKLQGDNLSFSHFSCRFCKTDQRTLRMKIVKHNIKLEYYIITT